MQSEQEPENTAKCNDAQEGGGDDLPRPQWLPRGLFDALGPLALLVVVVGGAAAFYAYYYVTKDSVRFSFWIGFMFSFMALIVVTIQVVIYAQQAQFMKAQLKISQDAFNLLERPSLGALGATLEVLEAGKNAVAVVEVRNSGHLPARAVDSIHGIGIHPAPPAMRCPQFRIVPNTDLVSSRDCIAINATRLYRAATTEALSAQQVLDIEAKRQALYVMARITYGWDGKSTPYFLEYYARYDPDTRQFDVCDTKNDAN